MKDAREIGIVKWFNDGKGYGFIRRMGQRDIFVHYSAISSEFGAFRSLSQGNQVEFTVADGPKGPEAKDVVVIAPAAK